MKAYVHKDGKQYGPFTVEQLRQYVQKGNFTAEDLACCDGQNWVKIAQVSGFAAGGDSVTTPQQDQAVQEHAVEQQPASADASNPPSKKKKTILWMGIGGVATLLVAVLLIWPAESIDLDGPGVPAIILCGACKKEVPTSGEACPHCSHPIIDSLWAFWEANPEPFGGPRGFAKIREAKETGFTHLSLTTDNKITDLTPLAGLTELKVLKLHNNEITDLTPLAGLKNLRSLWLYDNQITDLTPLAGLTELQMLILDSNRITDATPLTGLTKLKVLWLSGNRFSDRYKVEAMLEEALPECRNIKFMHSFSIPHRR